MTGTLYVVGTPIGNLEDVTLRALRILREVDLIAAEDTRHTGRLLRHYGIQTPFISYHEYNERARLSEVIRRLQHGENVAVVSDAGMPTIADPGFILVRSAVENEIPIIAVPGPTAVITALVTSGLPTDRFVFEGFLPRKGSERRAALDRIATERRTTILYEAPHRLCQSLADLDGFLGGRPIVVCREMTKRYEEVIRGTAAYLSRHFNSQSPRGEFVLVVGGKMDATTDSGVEVNDLKEFVATLEDRGMDHKTALKEAAIRLGVSRRKIYERLHKKAAPLPD